MQIRFYAPSKALPLLFSLAAPLLEAQCVWKGREDEVGTVFEWTWTQRGSSNDYDEVRRNTRTGKVDKLVIRQFENNPNRTVVFGRAGFVGRHRGAYAADGRTAKGFLDWTGGPWSAEISGCDLARPEPAGPAISGIAPGAKWAVVESSGNDRYEAIWTVLADGKSIHVTWKRFPSGQSGIIEKMGWIESVQGDQIVIQRPGLGRYTGTIDPAKRTITGKPSWSDYKWEVRLAGGASAAEPPKPPQILVDTAQDMGTRPVFRTVRFGPFAMKVESAWKESIAQKSLTLTAPVAKIRFEEQAISYKSAAERTRIVTK